MTHAEMSNAELAFRLRRLGRRAPQWLAVVADRLEGKQADPALIRADLDKYYPNRERNRI